MMVRLLLYLSFHLWAVQTIVAQVRPPWTLTVNVLDVYENNPLDSIDVKVFQEEKRLNTGTTDASGVVQFTADFSAPSIEEVPSHDVVLLPTYPNPLIGTTSIPYSLEGHSRLTVTVRSSDTPGGFTALAIIPGANQIANGNVWKGVLIAGLEVAAVGLFIKYNGDIAAKEDVYHRVLEAYRFDPGRRNAVGKAIEDVYDTRDKRDLFLYAAAGIFIVNLLDNLLF